MRPDRGGPKIAYKKTLKSQSSPETITTDGLRCYRAKTELFREQNERLTANQQTAIGRSMTRAGDAAVQADEVTSEVRLTPRSAYRAPKRSYLLASERRIALGATRDEHSANIVPIARANTVNRNIKHEHGCVSKAQSC